MTSAVSPSSINMIVSVPPCLRGEFSSGVQANTGVDSARRSVLRSGLRCGAETLCVRSMMGAKSADEILGLEFDWLASDADGHVALFSTAGGGYAPEDFL